MEKIIVQIGWCDNYCAASDEILGCVACSDTIEGIKKEYRLALDFHIKGMLEDGDELPEKLKNEYELVFELDTSAMLHSLDGIVTRKAIAKVTGINEALLTHYANGFRKPRPVQRQRIIDGIHQIGRELTLIG